MMCPLCGQRRARRACPALGRDICTVCCGTKRLVDIPCPPTCGYLASAREHPPAVAIRRHQQDLDAAVQLVRDLNQRQTQIFFVVAAFIARYQPGELHTLIDEDVAEAASALAATYETAARGVIYEHHASTATGARLAEALRPILLEAGRGTPFERDAAVVLRRIEGAARHQHGVIAGGPRTLVEMLGRVIRKTGEAGGPAAKDIEKGGKTDEPSRLIVP